VLSFKQPGFPAIFTLFKQVYLMSIVKKTEVMASSTQSREDATQQAVTKHPNR
jgi:hypothetical protein